MSSGTYPHKLHQLFQKDHKGYKSRLGSFQTDDAKKKIAEAKKGNKNVLGKHWKLSKEAIENQQKVRNRNTKRHWKGGISKNKDYISWLKNKRNRMPKIGSHTWGEWETLKAQYNWTCPCCHKLEREIKLTQDHIIPLSKGGSDNIENIQPLCGGCNSVKHTKIIIYENNHIQG